MDEIISQYELVRKFEKYYPQYTPESLESCIKNILNKYGEIDARMLDYYLKDPRAGGLGYGVVRYRGDSCEV